MADQEEVSPIKLLIQSIAKASWPDKQLYDLTRKALVSLDNDLEEGEYEPSSVMDEAIENLNEYLNPSEREEDIESDTEDEEDENADRDLDED